MNFFNRKSKSKNKKKKSFFLGGWEGRGEGVDSQTDNQDQTKLPLQFLRSWGHNNE